MCVFLWLQRSRSSSELKPLPLWQRWEMESEAIYTPPSPEKLQAGLSHKMRAGEMEWRKNNTHTKKRRKRVRRRLKFGEEAQGWLPACLSFWAPVGRCASVLFAQRAEKVHNSKGERECFSFNRAHTHTHTHTIMCVALNQGSNRAGFPDVSYYPVALTRPSWTNWTPSALNTSTLRVASARIQSTSRTTACHTLASAFSTMLARYWNISLQNNKELQCNVSSNTVAWRECRDIDGNMISLCISSDNNNYWKALCSIKN